MNVSAIFPRAGTDQASVLQNANRRTEFQKLTQALQSAELTSTQQAIGALLKNLASSGLQSLQSPQALNAPGTAEAYSPAQQGLPHWHSLAAHHHRPRHPASGAAILTSGFPGDTGSSDTNTGSSSAAFQPVNVMA